jgi:hypothetical protein
MFAWVRAASSAVWFTERRLDFFFPVLVLKIPLEYVTLTPEESPLCDLDPDIILAEIKIEVWALVKPGSESSG